jgi:hypothetical protein
MENSGGGAERSRGEHDEVEEVLVPNGLEGETKRLPAIVGMNIKW